jgi:hypothetical protein
MVSIADRDILANRRFVNGGQSLRAQVRKLINISGEGANAPMAYVSKAVI